MCGARLERARPFNLRAHRESWLDYPACLKIADEIRDRVFTIDQTWHAVRYYGPDTRKAVPDRWATILRHPFVRVVKKGKQAQMRRCELVDEMDKSHLLIFIYLSG